MTALQVNGTPRAAPVASRPVEFVALPLPVDLTLYAGDDFWLTVRVSDMHGEPYKQLPDGIIRAQIRQRPEADEVLGIFEVQTIEELVVLHLLGSVSAVLPAVTAYDVELAEPARTITLIAGRIVMRPEVTRNGVT